MTIISFYLGPRKVRSDAVALAICISSSLAKKNTGMMDLNFCTRGNRADTDVEAKQWLIFKETNT